MNKSILAIDAAWTADNPSGVALLTNSGPGWQCCAVAPSYGSFIALSCGTPVDWRIPQFAGDAPEIPALVTAARRLLPEGSMIEVVPVDIPVATVPITGRRTADRLISRHFGGSGCSAHSPGLRRPGPLGVNLLDGLTRAGFPLATATAGVGKPGMTVEVYPHPALLLLMQKEDPLPYKVNRTGKYWPNQSVEQRKGNVLVEFLAILARLQQEIHGIDLPLPESADGLTFRRSQEIRGRT